MLTTADKLKEIRAARNYKGMNRKNSLNTLVKSFERSSHKLEIDRLEDTKGMGDEGGYIYHLFEMNGIKPGRSVGGDFVSIQEAMEWAAEEYSTI